ncbi:GMC oxidoreductase-domain-containing protein, partial [Ephemerocybe angulata]
SLQACMQSTIGNGERYSPAKGYLTPTAQPWPNLAIVLNAYITRVLPVKPGRKLDIRTIEIAPRYGGNSRAGIESGARRTLTASKELIVSAGVIGSPQILLNSGNKAELTALGIPSVQDSPDVGQGIMEHVSLITGVTTVPLNTTIINEETALAMWKQNRTGPLTVRLTGHQLLWYRLPAKSPLFKEYKDPPSGTGSPHIEWSLDTTGSGSLVLLAPYSRGTLKLRSNNSFDKPRIYYNLLSHPYDIAALKEALRSLKRYYSGPAWDGFVTGFKGPDPDALSNEALEKAIRDGAFTSLHPVGSAQMSPKNSKRGVVDPDLRVKGLSGLRIVDASVRELQRATMPAGHTQAPVYILAERAVDFIRESW